MIRSFLYESFLKFEWDENKDDPNRKKHGVSFKEASAVFPDEDSLPIPDPDHSGPQGKQE